MLIEHKPLTPTSCLLYFSHSFNFNGCFYSLDKTDLPKPLENLLKTDLAKEVLLTSDFIYIVSQTPETLSTLKALTLAEFDDFDNIRTSHIAPYTNLQNKISLILSLIISPFLQRDGGNIELVSITSNTIKVKFLGKCHGCPYAMRTLKEHVEKNIIRYLPQIKEVQLAW